MSQRLTQSAKNRKSFKENQQFLSDITQENQLLNAMVVQKKLTRQVRGNIFVRYFNWALGINPMLKIMDNRERISPGTYGSGTSPDKGGSGSNKAGSS